jgi:hypothetical protein
MPVHGILVELAFAVLALGESVRLLDHQLQCLLLLGNKSVPPSSVSPPGSDAAPPGKPPIAVSIVGIFWRIAFLAFGVFQAFEFALASQVALRPRYGELLSRISFVFVKTPLRILNCVFLKLSF